MQQFVCLPYHLMRSAAGVIVVLAQLQNHCRSRETCSFGTPDAVVCRAARSASAALAAVGPSVGIGPRIEDRGFCMYVCMTAHRRIPSAGVSARTPEWAPVAHGPLLAGEARACVREPSRVRGAHALRADRPGLFAGYF